jgi:hypothetical protein
VQLVFSAGEQFYHDFRQIAEPFPFGCHFYVCFDPLFFGTSTFKILTIFAPLRQKNFELGAKSAGLLIINTWQIPAS